MLDVDADKAEVIVTKGTVTFRRRSEGHLPSVQAFGLEDTPDAVAIEVRQEMGDDEGGVVEWEVGGAPQAADDGASFFSGFPRELVWAGGVVKAIRGASLAPFAHGLGADAVTLRDDAAGFDGAGEAAQGFACAARGRAAEGISARVAGVVRAFGWMCSMGHSCPRAVLA